MKKSIWVLLIGVVILEPVWAGRPFSLMLTRAEQTALEKALGIERRTGSPRDYDPERDIIRFSQTFFLSAILYFAPDKWTLWLNDQVISNRDPTEGMILKSVLPDRIICQTTGEENIEFSLKPNQSFIVDEKRVVEGDKRFLSLSSSQEKDKMQVQTLSS